MHSFVSNFLHLACHLYLQPLSELRSSLWLNKITYYESVIFCYQQANRCLTIICTSTMNIHIEVFMRMQYISSPLQSGSKLPGHPTDLLHFSPSIFIWVPGIKFRSLSLISSGLYLWGHLTDSLLGLFVLLKVYQTSLELDTELKLS